MNKRIIYPAIGGGVGIVVAAIIVFAILGNGSFSRVVTSGDNLSQSSTRTPSTAASVVAVVKPIDIKLKNVVVINKASSSAKAANIQVAFDIHNPNTNTMILDGILYNVYANNTLLASGNIGTEAPEDVVRSQQGFPIIGNSATTLKDTQAIKQNSTITTNLDKIVANEKTSYKVNGTYSYRQTANLQAGGGVNNFSLKFPP
jgi:LEA14-like dessication related protein